LAHRPGSFFNEFSFVGKVAIIHWKMYKNWRSSREDLAKYAINPKKSFIILLYVWLHHENLIYESGDFFPFFFSLLATENLQNHFFSNFLFIISLFRQYKKRPAAACRPRGISGQGPLLLGLGMAMHWPLTLGRGPGGRIKFTDGSAALCMAFIAC
jgi:hypothetical protein